MEIREIEVDGYERVVQARDEATGLNAFVGIHDTTLGPALGGMRIWPYDTEDEALTDVLRLSKGMTYKSAIARTGLGGGKSVIIGDPDVVRNPDTLRAMGRFIDQLGGRYITAEDVNTRISDLEIVREETRWVTGLAREKGGSGNPSPYTARGVYIGIRTTLEAAFGDADPKGKRIAVQGVGAVASHVIDHLLDDGAHVIATDIDEEKIAAIRSKHPQVEWVASDAIYDVDCDVFSPHALGAVINDGTIERLKCRAIAGAANNQLATVAHGDELVKRDILYAPDFVINAGGIINVGCEFLEGGYDEELALGRIDNIAQALRDTFAKAREDGTGTNRAAIAVAKERLAEAKKA